MLYSDKENQIWWDRLGKTGQSELLIKIFERATVSYMRVFAKQIERKVGRGEQPTPRELINLRKWE